MMILNVTIQSVSSWEFLKDFFFNRPSLHSFDCKFISFSNSGTHFKVMSDCFLPLVISLSLSLSFSRMSVIFRFDHYSPYVGTQYKMELSEGNSECF